MFDYGDAWVEVHECKSNREDHKGQFAVVPYAAGGCCSENPHYEKVADAVDHKNRQNERARARQGKR